MKSFKLLINGELVDGAGTLAVINPASGEVFQQAPRADESQLQRAVAAARTAFPGWSSTSVDSRRELLLRLAAAIEEQLQEFARTLTLEQGKPLEQAQGEILACLHTLRQLAGMDLAPRVIRDSGQSRVVEYRKPLGVVAAITPWNFPVLLLIYKLAPALLAGNTLVVKPAPTTPLTTLLIGELCADIFPAGVVNTLVDDNDLGDRLTSHPQVDKVSFTGSTATGRKVLASSAPTLKRCTLELGGNDPALVLDDVDVVAVAAKIYQAAIYNAGQVCVAIKRVYLPQAIHDDFCAELRRLAAAATVGDGLDQGTQVGPLQNRAHFDKVRQLLADTRASGAMVAGGEVPDRPGYFVSPAIVCDVADDARIVAAEQFAPILPILRYRDLDDAIARINATEFGLGGSVWSADPARAEEVARRIDCGTVWINSHLALDPTVPFRGTKQSGIGVELGQEGLEEYTQAQVVMAGAAG